jgi:hypothetical protein
MNKRARIQETLFMDKLRRLAKPLVHVVAFGVIAVSVHLPAAHAAVVGTEAVVAAQHAEQQRSRLQDLLSRDDVKQRLQAAGVDPQQAAARVDALTDNEVAALASKIDEMPAGGDTLGVVVFIFVVLLITDILGFTDIFPFVNKPARR